MAPVRRSAFRERRQHPSREARYACRTLPSTRCPHVTPFAGRCLLQLYKCDGIHMRDRRRFTDETKEEREPLADLDASLVQPALEELGARMGADHDGGGIA